MKSVYLAGFDVFRVDAIEHGDVLKRLCARHGLLGLYPLDDQPPAEAADIAQWICQANLDKLRRADAVLANLDHFRGPEPDSGTVFEVGFACALGKPVWAYFPDHRSMREQVEHNQGYCAQGYQVEDFDLPRNLMLACSWAGCSRSVEEALSALSAHLR
ncbi:MAG: nucleoside 2-deoxyribosyltransferase [Halopseudomonas sp.]|uniref:nucleoside 2-deoxyribosyltransferase n=1 Tax=Halopseudomonas sp. TaxID=2901191 RepID=UPI0030027764